MNKKITNRFTLIELMMVMGLMVLMVSLAMPAFSKMAGNNKLDVMASNIKIALEQGQSTAVSRNCHVAVVFPNTNCSGDAVAYAFGGYRLAEVSTTDGASFTFVRWISDSYMNKPDGAYLAAAQTSVLKVGDQNAPEAFDGAQLSSAVTGIEDGITGNVSVIFKPTGESINNEMYLVIASGSVSNKTLTTVERSDYRQLKLNPFTGRVDYVSDDESTSTGGDQ